MNNMKVLFSSKLLVVQKLDDRHFLHPVYVHIGPSLVNRL